MSTLIVIDAETVILQKSCSHGESRTKSGHDFHLPHVSSMIGSTDYPQKRPVSLMLLFSRVERGGLWDARTLLVNKPVHSRVHNRPSRTRGVSVPH
jgi:hypothetical protein